MLHITTQPNLSSVWSLTPMYLKEMTGNVGLIIVN